LTAIEPSAESGPEIPGLIVTLAAPEVVQLSVVLVPPEMEAGVATNELMMGAGLLAKLAIGAVQPDRSKQAIKRKASVKIENSKEECLVK
jgi:hypothetical protein